MPVMIFFQRLISELPRPIALKLCHMVGMWLNFIIPLQKFGGVSPQKFGRPKTCKIRSIFATSDFDREYLQKGSTYPISEKKLLQPQPLPRCAKKNLVNFGIQTTESQWCILTHLNGFFREKIRGLPPKKIRGQKHAKFGRHRPLRGAAPSNFYTC